MKTKLKSEPCSGTVLNFTEMIQHVNKARRKFTRIDLSRMLLEAQVNELDYREFVKFAEPYSRISVAKSPAAEMFVMTWHERQESVIHDHHESACGIRVLQGNLTETMYSITSGDRAKKVFELKWPAGAVRTSAASFDIHKVANTDADALVTLHIYSPPLDPVKMRRFAEDI